MQNKKILFLATGGHPVHLAFAKAIGADIQKMSWKIPKKYKIYISEASYIRTTLLKKIGLLKKNSILINIFADPRLHYINKNHFFDKKRRCVKKYPPLKRKFYLILLKKLDGAICVGKMVSELFQKYTKDKPFFVTPVVLSEEREKILDKITPNLNSHNFVFIGSGPDINYKGLDLLTECFKIIKKEIPDAKLNIIGDWDKIYDKHEEGIFFVGTRQNIEDYLKNSSMMIHFGRGDTFPTTTIEAMRAGIITLVSNETGTKEIVSKIDKNNVLELDAKKTAERAVKLLKMPLSYKKKLSIKYKKEAKRINRKKVLKDFKKNFGLLIKKIEEKNDKKSFT